jgi:hypothetical protein
VHRSHAALQRTDFPNPRSHGIPKQKEDPMIKNVLVAFAAASIAWTPLAALAQSAPSPINQTGPSITPPVSSPTDMGIEGVSGNTQAGTGGIYMGASRTGVDAGPGYRSYAAAPGYDQRTYGSSGAGYADMDGE